MIKELTPIRFALCMMIFTHHAYSYAAGGAPAVATFFILSGFCLTLGYKERILFGAFNYIDYLKVRFAKFYTIHWITLLAFVIIAFCTGDLVINKRIFLTNFLLLQSWIPEQSYYFSYNAIAWYLSTALFAYLCFPMIITMLHKIQLRQRIGLFVAMLIGYFVVAYAMPYGDQHAMLYINPVCRCVDFVIGIYLAELFTNIKTERIKKYGWLFDIGLISSFVVLNVVSMRMPETIRTIGALFWLPACAMILCSCLASKTQSPLSKLLSSKAIQNTTACSFSLMMWSLCVIKLFGFLNVANGAWGGAIMFFGTYAAASISYWFVEKKLTNWIINKVK